MTGPKTSAEWGVYAFERNLGGHVLTPFARRKDAEQARDETRRSVDAWALLMHQDAPGQWTPDTTHAAPAGSTHEERMS